MASYSEFKAKYMGRAVDVDGYYGAQCWDGYAKYMQYLGYKPAYCTTSGYVKDIYTNRKDNGMATYCREVHTMNPGDIAVFKEYPGFTPVSHVAIFDSDAGNGFGWFFGQNQGGAAYPGGGGAFNLAKLPYAALYDTAFRPLIFGGSSQGKDKTGWDENGVAYVGCTVKSKSLPIQGVVGTCVRCDDLGGLVPLAHVSEAPDSKDGKVDNYLASTNARIYLDECKVTGVDKARSLVKVHGYWIKAAPLMVKR